MHRRIPSPLWADKPPPPPDLYDEGVPVGLYHVVLEHIDVSYDIDGQGEVLLRGARPNVVASQQRGLSLIA